MDCFSNSYKLSVKNGQGRDLGSDRARNMISTAKKES